MVAATVVIAICASSSPVWAIGLRPVGHPATKPKPKPPAPSSAIAKGTDSIQLLAQPAWVGPAQTVFELRLAVTASDEADETLAASVYGALTARSAFQAAVAGEVPGAPYESPPPVPLAALKPDAAGGVDFSIPVNQPGFATFTTGVYPVQVFLQENYARVGQPLTVFLVFAGTDATHLQPLDASVVVPLAASVAIDPRSGSPEPLAGPVAAELLADISVLASHTHVPVTVGADLPTLEALIGSRGASAPAATQLAAAAGAGDELLASPALPMSLPSLVASDLTDYLEAQLVTGIRDMHALVGTAPSPQTWALPGGTDTASAEALAALGARELVVPDANLSTLSSQYQGRTFGWPTRLAAGGARLEVIGADTELSERIAQAAAPGAAVLVANQVLAELAMIDLETPSYTRGVVLLAPPGVLINPIFLSVLLSGLDGDPLVRAETVATEFNQVPLQIPPGNAVLTRSLQGVSPGPPLAGAMGLTRAAGAVNAVGEVFGRATGFVSSLGLQLMIGLSSVWDAKQRQAIISGVLGGAEQELAKVHLPPPNAITLTSHTGRLPLTILLSASVPVHVRLSLTSEELSFLAQRFAEGSCAPVSPSSETCQLTLTKTTTLQVPVAVRTSGVFQLSLALDTPDGGTQLATATETVRSTATNDVALGLMVGALIFLGVWWARNARHGRRAKKLVPRPAEDSPGPSAAATGLPA
ncbi:MAG TPA: DUF6049 family protein [Acidimicrobiales bacterium]|nr:DUF6049 family protein [Acidimicrobiales bacterium]